MPGARVPALLTTQRVLPFHIVMSTLGAATVALMGWNVAHSVCALFVAMTGGAA